MIHPHLAQTGAAPSASSTSLLAGELAQQIVSDTRFLGWLLLLQVAFVLSAWLAARALVPRRELNSFGQYDRREGGGLGKGIGLYLTYAVLAVLGCFALRFTSVDFQGALLGVLTATLQPSVGMSFKLGLLGLVVFFFVLALPVLIFRIRLPRALLLLALIALLLSGAGWLLDVALGKPVGTRVALIRAEVAAQEGRGTGVSRAQAREDAFAAAEKTGQDTTRPVIERKAAVRSLYEQIVEMRSHLIEGDAAGLAEYQRRNARYEALLASLRAEIAAHPEAP